MLRAIIVTVALALTVAGRAAWAQSAPPAGNAEAEARAHFQRADAYFDKQAWREALAESHVRSRCHLEESRCPISQRVGVERATSLATASTVGRVVGGVGLVMGTVFVFCVRPGERGPTSAGPAVAWSADLGPGRFAIEGRF